MVLSLADTSRQLSSDDKILQARKKECKSNLNLYPFEFNHTLHRSGLFEIPGIVELAKRMIESMVISVPLNYKHGSIDTKFSAMPQSERLGETIPRLGENGTWSKLFFQPLSDCKE
jgi:hypothetical protein